MIPIFLILAAAVSHLADRHPETVRKMARGEYGTVAMVSLSMVMPGMAGGEQLQNAQNDPKTDKAKVLLCLVGMMGLNITMFMFRAALIGPELTLIWVGMGSWLLFQVWLGGKLWSCWFT